MSELINQIVGGDFWFLRYALLTALAGSVAFGVIGTLVVVRRITGIAGAIAHAVLGGVGVALFCQKVCGIEWFLPIYGALISSVLAALVIGLVNIYAKDREDTAIGAVWALGMAIGIGMIAKIPGYVDLQGYLFGSVLLQSRSDFLTALILDVVVLVPVVVFFNQIVAVCFDGRFAELRGVRTKTVYLGMLVLIALTIVLMVNLTGILLVIALLVLPGATAGCISKRLGIMMVWSAILCFVYTAGGIAISTQWDMPCGAVIVLIGVTGYLAALIFGKIGTKSA